MRCVDNKTLWLLVVIQAAFDSRDPRYRESAIEFLDSSVAKGILKDCGVDPDLSEPFLLIKRINQAMAGFLAAHDYKEIMENLDLLVGKEP